mmetsp:Transcript_122231/g.237644  ORF Transcript_122231/g.237644 Transcript_122231/m.237644 type:complete len:243 (+) Transcript_122231:410-1138(+)
MGTGCFWRRRLVGAWTEPVVFRFERTTSVSFPLLTMRFFSANSSLILATNVAFDSALSAASGAGLCIVSASSLEVLLALIWAHPGAFDSALSPASGAGLCIVSVSSLEALLVPFWAHPEATPSMGHCVSRYLLRAVAISFLPARDAPRHKRPTKPLSSLCERLATVSFWPSVLTIAARSAAASALFTLFFSLRAFDGSLRTMTVPATAEPWWRCNNQTMEQELKARDYRNLKHGVSGGVCTQ